MPASATRTPTPISHSLDARQAERIAIDTFLKYTAHKVKTYSVKEVTESATEWKFFIQGTKRFARPGYHWLVTVNSKSGAAAVMAGE